MIRISISKNLQEEIHFKSNMTCSLCKERDKEIQIHHIDENPSNNIQDNLIVLCLNCHAKIHKNGKMGKNYTHQILKKYRDEWYKVAHNQNLDISRKKNINEADEELIKRIKNMLPHKENNVISYFAQQPFGSGIHKDATNKIRDFASEVKNDPEFYFFNKKLQEKLLTLIKRIDDLILYIVENTVLGEEPHKDYHYPYKPYRYGDNSPESFKRFKDICNKYDYIISVNFVGAYNDLFKSYKKIVNT